MVAAVGSVTLGSFEFGGSGEVLAREVATIKTSCNGVLRYRDRRTWDVRNWR
jgi:hypothetical protein